MNYSSIDQAYPNGTPVLLTLKFKNGEVLLPDPEGPSRAGLIQSSAGVGSGRRRAIASSAVMSCITACKPVRIERNPARRKRFKAAVRSVAITPAPLPR